MRIYIKDRKRRKEEFQFFMHDFVEACREAGIERKKDLLPSYHWHVRAAIREVLLLFYRFLHQYLPGLLQRKEALMVTANGMTLLDSAFPYYGTYEIIPMLWDVWPYTWEKMYSSFKLLDVRMVFVTNKQVVDMINKDTRIHAYWIPEGIKTVLYQKGKSLEHRLYDVFEMGRQMPTYHHLVEDLKQAGKIKVVPPSNLKANGTLNDKRVAYTNEELYALIADTKIMVCFPQCDTNPARAGEIETLTQRYWEAMLSGCVMIGRAPAELIEVVGYNPVVEVDWGNPKHQLSELLAHLEEYQSMVNKNYETARRLASWEGRMSLLKRYLAKEGYNV